MMARTLRHAAFERNGKTCRDHAERVARHRREAVRCHIERHHRRLAPVLDHGCAWSDSAAIARFLERGHAFGQVVADSRRHGGSKNIPPAAFMAMSA